MGAAIKRDYTNDQIGRGDPWPSITGFETKCGVRRVKGRNGCWYVIAPDWGSTCRALDADAARHAAWEHEQERAKSLEGVSV